MFKISNSVVILSGTVKVIVAFSDEISLYHVCLIYLAISLKRLLKYMCNK